jgi:hypothetical protein
VPTELPRNQSLASSFEPLSPLVSGVSPVASITFSFSFGVISFSPGFELNSLAEKLSPRSRAVGYGGNGQEGWCTTGMSTRRATRCMLSLKLEALVADCPVVTVLKYIAQQLPGVITSLAVSWYFAERYFGRQRAIDENKEEKEVQLSYEKLVNAYIKMFGKRPKNGFDIREAMTEFELRLKVYRPAFNAKKMMENAAELAQRTINENPDGFEDIPKS